MKNIFVTLLLGMLSISVYAQSEFDKVYKAAKGGDAKAQFRLGEIYQSGIGVNKNAVEAFKWYLKAAEQGNCVAQNNLGNMYFNGEGIRKNEAEAVKWYMKAVEQGYTIAEYNLGESYLYGQGVPKNEAEAFKLFFKAASKGHSSSQYYLGCMYLMGQGVSKDEQEGVNWLIKSAEQGNHYAQCELGYNYSNGVGVSKNEKEAFNWFLKSAEQGNETSQYNVAICLYFGKGVERNVLKAAKWFKKLAEQGNAQAQYSLGTCYFQGEGVVKDEKKALEWYLKAAEQGNPDAQGNLGYMYSEGIGVEKNQNEAFRWSKMAAEAGNAVSQANLSDLYIKGNGTDVDYEKAYFWAQKAAKQNQEMGYESLAICYSTGSRKDINKAIECIDKAIELCNKNGRVEFDKKSLLRMYNRKGLIYLNEKDYAKAEEMAKMILDINPQYQDEDDNSLMVYMQTGKVNNNTLGLAQTKREKPSSDVDTTIPKMQPNNENTFAVIIANENYEEETPVEYALNDGEIFKTYCLNVLGLPETNIHYRADATLNNILAELEWMKQISIAFDGDAKFIFYYAGHGIPDEASGESYLLPIDGRGSILATGYSLKKLYDALGGLAAKSVTVFMDACFSGSVRNGGMMASARGVAIKAKQAAPKGNMIVLSAAQGNETAYPYKEKGHGLFTYHLLKKLQETKGDVTMGELADYITSEVKKRSIVVNGKLQTPLVTHSNSATDWRNWKLK